MQSMSPSMNAATILPLRYRAYRPLHRLLTSLGALSLMGKHPFIVFRNNLNRLMYTRVLTEHEFCVVETKAGFKIKIPLNDQAAASILFNQVYSEQEAKVLQALLTSCTAFLDVGANMGYFTLLGLRAMQGRGRVVALEPNPRLVQMIRESIALNRFTAGEVIQAGASGETGSAYFVVDPRLTSHGRVTTESDTAGSTPIDVLRVDDVLARFDQSENWLIKIDVEGLEAEVLQGCSHALEKKAIVLCEVFRDSAQKISTLAEGYGYKMLSHSGEVLGSAHLAQARRSDIVLTPSERTAEIQRLLVSVK